MQKLSFKISDFEGPLDLLLFLISKHKLNILDIEISELLSQYLLTIENREDFDLEVASEFLEMAARLVHIKTVSLLPKHEEEADKLRTQLTGELMEYHLCKIAAQKLSVLATENVVFVRKPMVVDLDLTYQNIHSANILFNAAELSVGRVIRKRPPSQEEFSPLVTRRVVSVNSRIIHLLRRFYKESQLPFGDVFSDGTDRSELVATFLAVLELIKAKRLVLSEDGEVISFNRHKIKA